MPKLPCIDYIQFLVNRRFPGAYPDETIHDATRMGRVPLESNSPADTFRQELLLVPKDELESLYKAELHNKNLEDDETRFFNKPGAKANIVHWGRMPYWGLEEALVLTFGKDPRCVTSKGLQQILFYTSPFVTAFRELEEVARRALNWKQLYDPVLPGLYIAWVKRNGYSFPSELEAEVASRGGFVGDWKTVHDNLKKNYDELIEINKKMKEEIDGTISEYEKVLAFKKEEIDQLKSLLVEKQEKPLGERERQTLLKLVIGMAVGGYSHTSRARVEHARAQ